MSSQISRRAVVGATLATAAGTPLAAAPIAVWPAQQSDAGLLALVQEHDAAIIAPKEELAIVADVGPGDSALSRAAAIFHKIARTEAKTLKGLLAEARVGREWCEHPSMDMDAELKRAIEGIGVGADTMGVSLVRDLPTIGRRP